MTKTKLNDCELIATTMGTLGKLLKFKDPNLLYTYVHLKYWVEVANLTNDEYETFDIEFNDTIALSKEDRSKALKRLEEIGIIEDDGETFSIK